MKYKEEYIQYVLDRANSFSLNVSNRNLILNSFMKIFDDLRNERVTDKLAIEVFNTIHQQLKKKLDFEIISYQEFTRDREINKLGI